MMKALKKKRKGGFTLIELIVVIAILGILAAIAIPRFAGFTDKADKAADDQYLALVVNTVRLMLADGTLSGGGTATIAADGDVTLAGFTGFAAGNTAFPNFVSPKAFKHYTGDLGQLTFTSAGVVSITGTWAPAATAPTAAQFN